MAIAIIISRHWIGITLDSLIPSYWIALIMRILDGSILPVHEPERQTMDCVDSRTVIGNRCENTHLIPKLGDDLRKVVESILILGES